jgi:hypothetical protein
MIVVRNVFQMKFGKAKEVKALMKEFSSVSNVDMQKDGRVLFDLVGPSYTMVMEMTSASLADFEQKMQNEMGRKEWGEWYQKFTPLMESSYREIFTVME